MLERMRMESERGSVMITAMMLIAVMVAVGLAILSRADTQTGQSRTQRVDESTFNYAEAALTTQIYILGRKGTGTVSKPYPESCPTAGNEFCPDAAKVALNYSSSTQPDYDSSAGWQTWVRDNATSTSGSTPDTFWTDSLLTSRPRYDQNGDKLMWVRAQATVRGRKRAMVGLIRIEPRPVTFPGYAILSGKFRTTNNGIHASEIVNTTGSLGVQVRCNASSVPQTGCIEYEPDKGQISPNIVNTGYPETQTVSQDDLESLVDVARANGTYYTSCPSSLTGDVVVLDTGGDCSFQGNTQHNSLANPGLLIIWSGRIEFLGTTNFYGLIYHPNLSNANDYDLVRVHGNSQVVGGVIVDGKNGGVSAGSSGKLNIKFDANAFNDINSFGTAGVVQNTWREIKPM